MLLLLPFGTVSLGPLTHTHTHTHTRRALWQSVAEIATRIGVPCDREQDHLICTITVPTSGIVLRGLASDPDRPDTVRPVRPNERVNVHISVGVYRSISDRISVRDGSAWGLAARKYFACAMRACGTIKPCTPSRQTGVQGSLWRSVLHDFHA